jgi:hypothetical protein
MPWRLSCCPPPYLFRDSITRPANLFRPASHLPLRERTRASLPTCWLGFSRMGLEQLRSHPLDNNDRFHRASRRYSHCLGLILTQGRACW